MHRNGKDNKEISDEELPIHREVENHERAAKVSNRRSNHRILPGTVSNLFWQNHKD